LLPSGVTARGPGTAPRAIYAQWIPVVAVDQDGKRVTTIVPADRKGVTLVDDIFVAGNDVGVSPATDPAYIAAPSQKG